jgi:replication fork clamp-binding protein CrfC
MKDMQTRTNYYIQETIESQFYFHPKTHNMAVSSQETAFASSLLTSKYLVVVLGMKTINFHLFNTPDFMEGAGVSQAAGIQTFRGTEGLFSQTSKKGSVLELFQKDTFEVRQPSPLPITC